MSILFKTNKPKGFNHKYIFVDERKEKLQKLEENAKRDLGMLPQETFDPERIRGRFVESTVHLKRKKEKGSRFIVSPLLLFALILLVMLLYYLLSGHLPFY